MFTNNWFETTAKDNFEEYILPMEMIGDVRFLEIGCYEGQASRWLMENTKAMLVVVDTFKGSMEHDSKFEKTLFERFAENLQPYNDRVIVKKGPSQRKLRELEFDSFDFIYVDGSHQASDVLEDAVLAFPLLRKGGIMIFDDYIWGKGMNYYNVPSSGINAFLSIYGNQIVVLEKNSQVVIKKIAQPL